MDASENSKDLVRELLGRLPEQVTLNDIAREIEFIAAVREGLAQLDDGDSFAIEDVARELPTWVAR